MHQRGLPLLLTLFTALPAARADDRATGNLTLFPRDFVLKGKAARQRLLVQAMEQGRIVDKSEQAAFRSEDGSVALVNADGVVTPVGDGMTTIVAGAGGLEARATVRVLHGEQFLPETFERDVEPILARFGCNSGACHGKARGQNNFQLSLLGFDADFDFAALTQEARGRRILPSAPQFSMLLRKPGGDMAHGGGKRLDKDAHDLLLRWIAAGTPRTPTSEPALVGITIEPADRTLVAGGRQQLMVTAHYADQSTRDVTHLAMYQSNESVIAAATPEGLVKAGPLPGEAAIMARFMEKFAVCNVSIPLPVPVPAEVYTRLPRYTFIDGLVWDKLQLLGLTPSEPCPDSTFLRRATIDALGRLPTPEESRAFLGASAPDKRAELVERLLARPEWADLWANKWADLLRPNPYRVGIKSVMSLDAWLRASFRANKPYDRFVREIITAQGSTFHHGPVTLFRDRREPEELTTVVSQLFLGIRLECTKCHHHPFEVWSQDDFYSFAAYFARIGRKGTGLSPPISGGEEVVFTALAGTVKYSLTGKAMTARPLFGAAPAADGDSDPRQALADWIVSPANPYFAKVEANRLWADLMGRGLVDSVDDLRASNPPSNGPLLDALAAHFRTQQFDLKKLQRAMMTSYVYGLSSLPNDPNAGDTRNFSRHYRQRLRAEVLVDAVSDITGVPETFTGMPVGSRAMQLWTVRAQSIFLDTFGRPDPNQDPPCERSSDTSVVQVLHLMNSPKLHAQVTSDKGRPAHLAASKMTPAEIIEELYLLVYSRLPSDQEKAIATRVFDAVPRRQAAEDLLWALINTPEFVFKD